MTERRGSRRAGHPVADRAAEAASHLFHAPASEPDGRAAQADGALPPDIRSIGHCTCRRGEAGSARHRLPKRRDEA